MRSAKLWEVPQDDFAGPMLNYLVYGYEPGSCFTAILANDFFRAVQHSHPSNTVESFKALAGWINESFPKVSYGSYQAVDNWTKLSDDERRTVLERYSLIFTEKEEMWMALKGVHEWEV
jgi:hypothetical protein